MQASRALSTLRKLSALVDIPDTGLEYRYPDRELWSELHVFSLVLWHFKKACFCREGGLKGNV